MTEPGEPLFEGSYMDGPDVDLLDWAGLTLTDEESDALWNDTNPEALIRECPSADMEEEEFDEGGPGTSDTFYKVFSPSPEEFRKELAAAIMAAIQRSLDLLRNAPPKGAKK